MKHDSVLPDGRWRPERWLTGEWIVVRYVAHQAGISRHVDEFRSGHGRPSTIFYPSEEHARKRAAKLNGDAS